MIFELAKQLGQALKADEKLIRLENAKKGYENDKDLQKMMVEYEVQQKALHGEITKEERDTMFIEIIQKRINELMNAVNNTITFEITGEVPSCTHNCSTCGGGCSH